MSLLHKLTLGLHTYIQKQDRDTRRVFIDSLEQYKYIMIYPMHEDDDGREECCINACFMVGFTNTDHYTRLNNDAEAYAWLETKNDENVFYIYSPYVDLCDKIYYISTADFPQIMVSPAPLELAINAPSIGEADPYTIAYHVYDYLGDSYQKSFDTILADTIKNIPEIEHYVIFNDTYKNERGIGYGRVTEIVKYKSEVLAFITKSGYDLCKVECFLMDHDKWSNFIEMIIVKSNIRDELYPKYEVIDPNKDCDIYFPVPGINGYYFNTERNEGDVL